MTELDYISTDTFCVYNLLLQEFQYCPDVGTPYISEMLRKLANSTCIKRNKISTAPAIKGIRFQQEQLGVKI